MFSTTVEVKGLKEVIARLDPKHAARAATDTVNRVGKKASTAASKEVRQIYNIKAKPLKAATKFTKARRGAFVSHIRAWGRPIPLAQFGARQNKRGVSVKVKKGGGKKTLTGFFIPNLSSGHKGVFARARLGLGAMKGRRVNRLPIEEMYGPSIPTMYRAKGVMSAINRVVSSDTRKTFFQRYRYYSERGR